MAHFNQYQFIDIHYHANPDLYLRRYDAITVGKHYQLIKGAVVLKSHLGSTAIQATLAQQSGLPVFPSIVLNDIAGGLDYRVILQALAEYQPVYQSKLIIHLPTITGRKHQSKLVRNFTNEKLQHELTKALTVFDDSNKLKKQITDIFKLTHDYPVTISTGHASKEETYALIELADKLKVSALMLNQPANPLTNLSAIELAAIVKKYPFVYVEQTALTYLLGYQTEQDFQMVLKDLPNVIYSSDLGQTSQMTVPEWQKQSHEWFEKYNLTAQRRGEICLTNPLQLLRI